MTYVMQATEGKFSSLSKQMGKWVDQVLGPTYHNYSSTEAWSPSINVYEDQTHYCLVVDLAGVAAEDILRVEEGRLIISGSRETPGLEKLSGPVRVHHMEIDHGRFCRTFKVPDDVDKDRIEASYRNGMLWIRMPKLPG